jgi:acetyl esterase
MSLHPVVETMLRAMREAGLGEFCAGTVEEARALQARMRASRAPRTPPPLAAIEDITVPGGAGARPARLYAPLGEPAGSLLYLHGGGWVLGDLETSHLLAAGLAAASGWRVLSLDYRLAPEHPYPAGLDDVMAALGWIAHRSGGPLAVGGDSAGGNLAAAAALRARAEGGPALGAQLLIYPALDDRLDAPSHRENGELGYVLTTRDMVWFWDLYAPAGIRSHPFVAPLREADLAGLPPAFVAVAGYDPLRDEGLAYAERLAQAGVGAEARCYDGVAHGFAAMVGLVDTADRAIGEMGGWLVGVAAPQAAV